MPNPIDSSKFPLTHMYYRMFHDINDEVVNMRETERIAFQIYHDICGRRGISYEFTRFVQEDPTVSEEILKSWVKIATAAK